MFVLMPFLIQPGQKNLVIRDVQIEDDGFYDCQILNKTVRMKSRRAYLNVTGKSASSCVPSFCSSFFR